MQTAALWVAMVLTGISSGFFVWDVCKDEPTDMRWLSLVLAAAFGFAAWGVGMTLGWRS